jgi:hypothetical protein
MKRSAVPSGLLLAAACAVAGPGWAFDFHGEKALIAVTRDGGQTRIGSVHFTAQAGGAPTRFSVRIDHKVMQDHFLSMREFKCLPAAQEISCFVPYPHPHPGTVGPGQLAWLEHNLLFFFKQPADFGAKLWNGVIFKFSLTPNGLIGTPQAVDLNRIAAPPEAASEPPFSAMDRDDFNPGVRWVQELRIE